MRTPAGRVSARNRRRWAQVIVAAAVGLLFALPAAAADEIEWHSLDSQGWQKLEERKYEQARTMFQHAVDVAPKDFRLGQSNVGLAWAHHRLGDHRVALACATTAAPLLDAALIPTQGEDRRQVIRLQQVEVLLSLGQLRSAKQQFQRIKEAGTPCHHLLVGALLAFIEARYHDVLETLKRYDPSRAPCPLAGCKCSNRLMTVWARTLVAVGDFQSARERIKHLAGDKHLLESDQAVVLAETAYAMGNFTTAETEFRHALASREKALSQTDPDLCHILLGLAATREAPHETRDTLHNDTVEHCNRVITILAGIHQHLDTARAHTLLAMRSNYLYKYPHAEESSATAVQMYRSILDRSGQGPMQPLIPYPDHASALEVQATSLWAQKTHSHVSQTLEDAREIRSRHFSQLDAVQGLSPLPYSKGNTELIQGWVDLCDGNPEEAQKLFTRAIGHFTRDKDSHPFDAEARLGLFLSRGATDQKTLATAEFYLIQRLGRFTTAYHLWRLGAICGRYDRNEEAWHLYKRAIALYQSVDEHEAAEADKAAKIVEKQLYDLVKRREPPKLK